MTIMTSAWKLERLAWAWQGCTAPRAAAGRVGRDMTAPALRGRQEQDVPMKKHVSWRAGGVADRAYTPKDVADLAVFLAGLPADEAVCCVGLGSNLLVRDGGFRGTVVFLHAALNDLFLVADGLVYAQAGVASPKVARFAAMHSLGGAEFLAGIPGTVGGALAMNAGCFGAETWEHVEKVETVNRQGRLRVRTPADYDIGYRHVVAKTAPHAEGEEWFAGAWFRFAPGDEAHARGRIKELLTRRIATQPLELPNAGSVFRNPPGDHAARLIEASGLKGLMMGGARVSEKHANFIVNPKGQASARDIETLIGVVRDTVRRQQGVDLIPEVRIVGEPR
jgi:UDP-N-acetylmuramate dehydrogenase